MADIVFVRTGLTVHSPFAVYTKHMFVGHFQSILFIQFKASRSLRRSAWNLFVSYAQFMRPKI